MRFICIAKEYVIKKNERLLRTIKCLQSLLKVCGLWLKCLWRMGMLISDYWLVNISLSTKVVRMGITCSKTEF